MKAAIAEWLEQQRAGGGVRVELWELAEPQRRIAAYDFRRTHVAAVAHEIALRVNEPTPRVHVGHALFAYVTDRPEEEAIGRVLLRGGVLVRADGDATSEEGRVLAMLLRECECCARYARILDAIRGVPDVGGR